MWKELEREVYMYLIKNILSKIFIYTNSHFFSHLFTSKIVSCSFHKYDKLGRPCYIEHTGRTDTTALMKVCSKHLKWINFCAVFVT